MDPTATPAINSFQAIFDIILNFTGRPILTSSQTMKICSNGNFPEKDLANKIWAKEFHLFFHNAVKDSLPFL